MGNSPSRKTDDSNCNKSLILLDDSFINNFQNQNDFIFEKKPPNVILENTDTSIYNKVHSKIIEDTSNKNEHIGILNKGSNYEELRKQIINELIAESEKYINEHKQELNRFHKEQLANPFLSINLTKNQCFNDENKIYECIKDMNKSTTNFVNYYNRCNQYLRNYENCVQKMKI